MIQLLFDCGEEETAAAMYHALNAAFFKKNNSPYSHLGCEKNLTQITLTNNTSSIDIDLRIDIKDCHVTVLSADKDRLLRGPDKKETDGQ